MYFPAKDCNARPRRSLIIMPRHGPLSLMSRRSSQSCESGRHGLTVTRSVLRSWVDVFFWVGCIIISTRFPLTGGFSLAGRSAIVSGVGAYAPTPDKARIQNNPESQNASTRSDADSPG